jgi:hypothetical protein
LPAKTALRELLQQHILSAQGTSLESLHGAFCALLDDEDGIANQASLSLKAALFRYLQQIDPRRNPMLDIPVSRDDILVGIGNFARIAKENMVFFDCEAEIFRILEEMTPLASPPSAGSLLQLILPGVKLCGSLHSGISLRRYLNVMVNSFRLVQTSQAAQIVISVLKHANSMFKRHANQNQVYTFYQALCFKFAKMLTHQLFFPQTRTPAIHLLGVILREFDDVCDDFSSLCLSNMAAVVSLLSSWKQRLPNLDVRLSPIFQWNNSDNLSFPQPESMDLSVNVGSDEPVFPMSPQVLEEILGAMEKERRPEIIYECRRQNWSLIPPQESEELKRLVDSVDQSIKDLCSDPIAICKASESTALFTASGRVWMEFLGDKGSFWLSIVFLSIPMLTFRSLPRKKPPLLHIFRRQRDGLRARLLCPLCLGTCSWTSYPQSSRTLINLLLRNLRLSA